jgi:hypothetical protein
MWNLPRFYVQHAIPGGRGNDLNQFLGEEQRAMNIGVPRSGKNLELNSIISGCRRRVKMRRTQREQI